LSMAGQYKEPVQYERESAHKNRAVRAHPSLGDYMFSRFNINWRRTSSSAGEVSSWRFCPAYTVRSSSAGRLLLFLLHQHFPGR
jgi:hypothetical protein